MTVGAGVAIGPLIKRGYYRSRMNPIQLRVGFQARIRGVMLDALTFCVKKWYNFTFTIHQFDNE
jgi:hypothetical protein